MNYFKKIFLILLVPIILFAEVILNGSLLGRSDGNNIIISWKSSDESGLKQFVVERKLFNASSFVDLSTIKIKGSNSNYEFVDESAFKTSSSIYSYRVRIEMQNGTVNYSQSLTISHHVSSVKRTWGSLKAMFK
ncbi:MAG: hypothetical protein O3A55_06285 [Bacteroidetes bacterium]|nr:hypothetical protein [Bacteroidota bacterium]